MRTADTEHHRTLDCAAKRGHRNGNSRYDHSRYDEANDLHTKATAAFHHATACSAAEAGHRLPGGGMTGRGEAGARTKAARI
jgi:hypothetical protein